ncbi:MAG: hypothetical protein R3275_02140 [Saprospiraceae bacterium]|nr:hypothetical protein [Saprospiraceae bacterium]
MLISLGLMAGCITPPDYPDEPVLTYEGMSKSRMNQGDFNTDSVFIFLSFTDGDGDIGRALGDTAKDITVIDTRTGLVQERFRIPEVPEEGTGNGIDGNLTIRMFNTCCLYDNGFPPCSRNPDQLTDTLSFKIYIKDRSGNESNRITTDALVLDCI